MEMMPIEVKARLILRLPDNSPTDYWFSRKIELPLVIFLLGNRAANVQFLAGNILLPFQIDTSMPLHFMEG
jgi:hypothetical protein